MWNLEEHAHRTDKGQHQHTVPSLIEEWENYFKKWPYIMYISIFNYIVDSIACDGKTMSNLKSSEAYQYLHSSKVGCVLFKDVGNDFGYLKADVEYDVWQFQAAHVVTQLQ